MTLDTVLIQAAEARPESEALVDAAERLDWRAYERGAAAVAAGLRAAGVVPGDRAAVARSKSVRSYVAMHGAIRAGAVAVPVDPLAPRQAIGAVLRDAAVAAVVIDDRTLVRADPSTFDWPELRVVVVDELTSMNVTGSATWSWEQLVSHGDAPPSSASAHDPAYIIYTSGSTGVPKGIVHSHASAFAYAERAAAEHGLHAGDRIAGMSPFHFDMSTLELYAAPHACAAVVVMDEPTMRFPADLVARTVEERVTVWYSVPSLFRQVVDRGGPGTSALGDHLRLVMFGGEVYPPAALAELAAVLPAASIENVYGPAEVNECTYHRVTAADLERDDDVPVGRPWPGAEVRVVDRDGADVETGAVGELWVSTPTVMSGYWRRADLDEQSLHPRADGPAWYATGDLVTRRQDGTLDFLGRRDHQVKVRGVRVELEGVESVLGDAPGVLHAVAGTMTADDGGTQLVAAVVPRSDTTFDEMAVRRFCTARLAPAAVPRQISTWSNFPRTPSGKIDRRAVRSHLATPLAEQNPEENEEHYR